MLSKERADILQWAINVFLEDVEEFPTIESINEGGCGEFAHVVNEAFVKQGLPEFTFLSTFSFISEDTDSGYCEYMKDWTNEALGKLGVSKECFNSYKKKVESLDPRGVVGYHVWLYDGELHYDATCVEGVANPLEMPFFQIFVKEDLAV